MKVKEVQLFAFSDKWVGNNVKYSLNGGSDKITISPSETVVSSKKYTLTIDLEKNTNVSSIVRTIIFELVL